MPTKDPIDNTKS